MLSIQVKKELASFNDRFVLILQHETGIHTFITR